MMRLFCTVLLLAVLGMRVIHALPVQQPAVAACYATDGVSVETTYVSGGAFYYPGPSDVQLQELSDGAFVVRHSTVFRRIDQRVYLPQVRR